MMGPSSSSADTRERNRPYNSNQPPPSFYGARGGQNNSGRGGATSSNSSRQQFGFGEREQAMSSSNETWRQQNDEQVNELYEKSRMLHGIAAGLGVEIGKGNKILDSMSPAMESVQSSLTGINRGIKNMMDRGGGNHMWMMLGFVLFIFFLMWFFMR